MIKRFLKSKVCYILLALMISVGLWCYVVINENPTYTGTLTTTNVIKHGLSDLTDKGFYTIGDLPASVEIGVTGPRNMVTKVSDDYSAEIDFSGIKGAGEYSLNVSVNAPSGVTVRKIKPDSIVVKIDVGRTKKVETRLNVIGNAPENFELSLVDKDISVSGPSSVISKITDFEVTVNTDEINDTGIKIYHATPLDSEGKEVTDENLTFDNLVNVNIAKVKALDIVVDESLVPAYIKDAYNVEFVLEKEKVRISGDMDRLENIQSIEADISGVVFNPALGTQKISSKYIVPKEMSIANGEEKTVGITIKYISLANDAEAEDESAENSADETEAGNE